MSLVHITADKHVVKETEASRFFRRSLNFPDIFTYWNSETSQWVLAYWTNKVGLLADEIEDLGTAMELMTPEFVQQIVRCWKDVDWGAKKRIILSKEKARITQKNEELIVEQEKWDWLRKRTKDKAPVPYGFYGSLSGGQ